MSTMNYFWRLIATGLCFCVFGLGGLLISIFVCPVLILLNRDLEVRKKKALKIRGQVFEVQGVIQAG